MYRQEMKLVIESKLLNVEILSNAIRGICSTIVKDEILAYQLVLCLVEAATNIIIHAYHRLPNHWIEVNVVLDQENISFELVDTGEKGLLPQFQKKQSEVSTDILTLPESGRGLFLIYNLMDEVSYSQNVEGKNVFKMVKNFHKIKEK